MDATTSTAILTPAEERVRLSGISWGTYERLFEEHDGRQSPRFTYDRGELEIMVISFEPEEANRLLHDLFTAVAEERELDFVNAGSTTLKREDLERGFEPDTCLNIRSAGRVRGKRRIELPADPPPDLVIEVDITSPSIDNGHLSVHGRCRGMALRWRFVALLRARGRRVRGAGRKPGTARSYVRGRLALSRGRKIRAARRLEQELRDWARAHPA